MNKKNLIQTVHSIMTDKQVNEEAIRNVNNSKPLRIRGQLYSLKCERKNLSIYPYGGGFLHPINLKELMSDDVQVAEHPSATGKKHAFFENI